MNRTMNVLQEEPISSLMGTLCIMGFAAEGNLRDVANALGQRNIAGLAKVAERNAKQPRLRAEIEEQIVLEMAQPTVGSRSRRKLILTSQIALMFERMGSLTVELSQLCAQIILDLKPSRVSDVKKLIEHAVYITDRAVIGFVEEEVSMAKTALEQKRAANELNHRITRELASLVEAGGEAAVRAEVLGRIACKAHGIIEEAGQLGQDVVAFLEKPEL